MASELEDKKQRAYVNRRSIMDLGMGIIYAGMGGAMMFAERVGLGDVFPSPFSYIFGGICLLYGGFRIYRGIKRNYYR
ncbi:hypothetical protein [Longitalea arenae]|uniref:hypothetical protein n=1 Tax=Longitalea arenae TaxID=2812558 RepID=UPI001967E13B|nr:hypothetical protein [Longitalea arenae]